MLSRTPKPEANAWNVGNIGILERAMYDVRHDQDVVLVVVRDQQKLTTTVTTARRSVHLEL